MILIRKGVLVMVKYIKVLCSMCYGAGKVIHWHSGKEVICPRCNGTVDSRLGVQMSNL